MKITYNKFEGITVTDGKIMEVAYTILKENNDVTITQELLVDAIRLTMRNNNIPHENVIFIFGDNIIQVTKDYKLSDWPVGFCDTWDKIVGDLITLQL